MLYVISPAKTMKQEGIHKPNAIPQLWRYSEQILHEATTLTVSDWMEKLHIKEALAIQTKQRFQRLRFDEQGTCAIEAYDGLQFKYMEIDHQNDKELCYLQEHLRILSALYGIVKPFDSVYPYRLEMQCKLAVQGEKDLYAYWNSALSELLREQVQHHKDTHILNLASKEYAQAIRPYLPKEQVVDILFQVEKDGKRRVEATSAKMARGVMIRYLAQHQIETLEDVKGFCEDGFLLDEERTGKQTIAFYKKQETRQ